MKTFYKIILVAAISLLTACYSNDDDDNRYINLNVEDALTFENNELYVVGDTIFFEVNFSRYLNEEGQPNKLDLFESTASDSFSYDLRLSKFSNLSSRFQSIGISPEFTFSEKGSIQDNGRIRILLNAAQDVYESRIGVILVEPGRFRLDLDFLYIINDGFASDKVQIEIINTSSGDPIDFEFTVTE